MAFIYISIFFWRAVPYSLFAAAFIFIPPLFIDIKSPFSLAELAQNLRFIISALFFWLFSFILLSALIFRIYCITAQLPLTLMDSIVHALSKLVPLLLLGVLYALMVISGTLFLIVPGIILAISLMFSFILFITENQNVLQTLLTSHRLVWGNWWHTLFVLSFPLLIDIAVSFSMLLCLVTLAKTFLISTTHLYLAVCISNILIQALFIPLIFSISLILLNDLRARQGAPLPRW